MSITEFLLARVTEDETAATEDSAEMSRSAVSIQFDCATQERFNPSRILAECAAKRAISERHASCDDVSYGDASTCPEMRTLAGVYADHPDYQQEWAV